MRTLEELVYDVVGVLLRAIPYLGEFVDPVVVHLVFHPVRVHAKLVEREHEAAQHCKSQWQRDAVSASVVEGRQWLWDPVPVLPPPRHGPSCHRWFLNVHARTFVDVNCNSRAARC
jgi:hypothetical protein